MKAQKKRLNLSHRRAARKHEAYKPKAVKVNPKRKAKIDKEWNKHKREQDALVREQEKKFLQHALQFSNKQEKTTSPDIEFPQENSTEAVGNATPAEN